MTTQETSQGLALAALDGGAVHLSASDVEELSRRLEGHVLSCGDEGWEVATKMWNAMVAAEPAIVVQPVSAVDVANAVTFACEHRLLLSVKGGGHNIAGTAVAENGMTLDMSRMRDVSVDPKARLARIGPGALLGDVDRATQEHGLATVLGFVSEVGVAGLTLGGGLGYLARRFGWTVDNLEEVEIVTADGEIRTASRHEHPDLFWAIRGGGGNFGVVTQFTFRLHEVGPTVYGGLIAWPFERAEEVLAAYRAMTGDAPRELAVWQIMLTAPPAPFVPEEWHGQKICAFAVCYTGSPERACEALGPIRALGDPILDLFHEQPYVEMQSYLNDTEPSGIDHYWKTEYLAELSDGFLATARELFAECPYPEIEIGTLHLEGALNERDWDDGAVGNRDARFVAGVKGMWEPGHPQADAMRSWIRDAWGRLRRYSTGRTYVNFLGPDEGDRVHEAYGTNYERLLEVKERYDPENLFRVNRNITRNGTGG